MGCQIGVFSLVGCSGRGEVTDMGWYLLSLPLSWGVTPWLVSLSRERYF
jgi:hypothetical protein